MEQKFQRGFRVLILSRLSTGTETENYGVGKEAIIEFSDRDLPLTGPRRADVLPYYSLLILFPDHTEKLAWYDENFLELICCNADKGKKILAEELPVLN